MRWGEPHEYLGRNIPGRGKNQCKVPEMEEYWHVGEETKVEVNLAVVAHSFNF